MTPNSSPSRSTPPSAMAKRDAAANLRQLSSLASSCFDLLLEPRDLVAGVGGFGGQFVHAGILARAGAARQLS